MKRRATLLVVLAALAVLCGSILVRPAAACVGKTLMVGALDNPQQQVLAQMLAILISERTGTTVKVVAMPGHVEAHEALLRAELDMYVEYTGVGQVTLLKGAPIRDADGLYQAVKERYNQDFNLVWLQPFGFDDPRLSLDGISAQAAPVVRKDTLKKFPALARLINKLGGAIDLATMQQLEVESAGSGPRDTARKFLKENRFI